MWFYFPDTLNKSLEEVAQLFDDADLVAFYGENGHVPLGNDSLKKVSVKEEDPEKPIPVEHEQTVYPVFF